MPFPQAPAGARRILDGLQRSVWLWCCGRSCSWCSRHMTTWSSPAGSGRGRRGPVREWYKVVALLLKLSLGLFGLVGQRRVLLPHPVSATGHVIVPGDHQSLQHIQVHFGVDFQADFEDVRWHDVTLTWNHTKDHNRCQKLSFYHTGHVSVIRGNADLHFEGAGNGAVVITWIGREHELYCGASPISLVEHCVTFRHDRRLLSLLGFVHNWPTSRWSAAKKRKPVFIKRKWNHVVFSRATILSFHPVEGSHHSWNLYTTGQLVDGLQQKKKTGFFIKRKWNHVFSRATILLFHPVEGSYRSWDLYTTGQLVDGLQQKKKTGFH